MLVGVYHRIVNTCHAIVVVLGRLRGLLERGKRVWLEPGLQRQGLAVESSV